MEITNDRNCIYFEILGYDSNKEVSTVSIYCRKKQRHIGLEYCFNCEEAQEQGEE